MRVLLMFFIAVLMHVFPVSAVFAEPLQVQATSQVEKVTVFPSGASVTRVLKVKLEKGDHEIVVGDLPSAALPNSIRVEGQATGALFIGSVDSRRLKVTEAQPGAGDNARKQLEDAIEDARDRRAIVAAEIETATTKKKLIANLANLPNQPAPVGAGVGYSQDWSSLLSTISTEMSGVQRDILEAQKRLRDSDKEIKDLEKQLAALKPKQVQRTEVKIFAQTETPVEATLSIRYQVRRASWTPLYDARLTTGSKTEAPQFKLTRRARITNRSGEDWKDVGVQLSTTRPNAGSAAPGLPTMTVDFEQPAIVAPMALELPAPAAEMDEAFVQKRSRRAAPAKARRKVAAVGRKAEVFQTPFQAVFAVPGTVTVAGTGAGKNVTLTEDEIKPQLTVRTVPSREAKAYLYAELKIPKGAPVLPGRVSLYRDGTFVGRGRLPSLAAQETHELGFGIDDLVRVRYSIEQEKRGETGLISSASTDSRNYKITVKNLHEREIAITVLDRMPVSQNEDIKVSLLGPTAPSKKDVKDKRGILAWEDKLGPDQEKVISFGYQVIWPAEKSIRYSR